MLIVGALALRAWALRSKKAFLHWQVSNLSRYDAHARRARATTLAKAAYILTVQLDFFLGKDIVLDTKYKYGVQREDYHQMITYQYILKGRMGGFISPHDATKMPRLGKLNGYGAELFSIHLGISKTCVSYADFRKKMEQEERMLCDELRDVLL